MTERECLAVKWAVDLFRPYIDDQPFTVYTDHAALRYLDSTNMPNARLTRWALALQGLPMTILQRPGSQNGNADALSRFPAIADSSHSPTAPPKPVIAAITRSTTSKLPATRRTGVDPSFVLDPRAYDMFGAVADSLRTADNESDTPNNDTSMYSSDTANIEDISDSESDDATSESDMDRAEQHTGGTQGQAEWLAAQQRVSESHTELTRLAAAQRADPQLLPYITYLLDPTSTANTTITRIIRRSCDKGHFLLRDNVLYKRASNAARSVLGRAALLPVIPQSLRKVLLHEYHDSPNSAHLGEVKTYERLADLYYWKGMAAEIKQYVATCHKCGQRKTPSQRHIIPTLSLPVATCPFAALGIDVLGPLTRTASGNKYVLVVTDYFTRWPMAFAMRNQKASTIATILVEQVFCQHGYPATLLSDQGTNFLSKLVAAVLALFAVKKLTTSAYHPQTNGLTERFNHTLCTMLSHFSNLRTTNWDTYIPYVLLAYRSAPEATTKCSPFYLLYGRHLRMPLDHILLPSATSSAHVDMDDTAANAYMVGLTERLKLAHTVVTARHEQIVNERRQQSEQMSHAQPRFTLGQLVYLHTPAIKQGTSSKLAQHWKGPYKIVQALHNRVNFYIQRCNEKGELSARDKQKLVHVARIKSYVVHSASSVRTGTA